MNKKEVKVDSIQKAAEVIGLSCQTTVQLMQHISADSTALELALMARLADAVNKFGEFREMLDVEEDIDIESEHGQEVFKRCNQIIHWFKRQTSNAEVGGQCH